MRTFNYANLRIAKQKGARIEIVIITEMTLSRDKTLPRIYRVLLKKIHGFFRYKIKSKSGNKYHLKIFWINNNKKIPGCKTALEVEGGTSQSISLKHGAKSSWPSCQKR